MAALDTTQEAQARAIAIGGRDDDLEPADKRSRGTLPGTLAVGDVVRIRGLGDVTVLGPGRGRNAFVAGYTSTQEALCIGTFTLQQVERP